MALDRRLYRGIAAANNAARNGGNRSPACRDARDSIGSSGHGSGSKTRNARKIQTTASSPSLRSTVAGASLIDSSSLIEPYYDIDDGSILMGGDQGQHSQQHGSEGGNVKVVVRVRAFVKRGEITFI